MDFLPHQLGRFPKRAGQRHLDAQRVEFSCLAVLLLLVLGVAAVAQLGDLGGAFGVYGNGRGRDQVRGVEGVEGAVQGVESGELGFEGAGLYGGEARGGEEGDGFALGVDG